MSNQALHPAEKSICNVHFCLLACFYNPFHPLLQVLTPCIVSPVLQNLNRTPCPLLFIHLPVFSPSHILWRRIFRSRPFSFELLIDCTSLVQSRSWQTSLSVTDWVSPQGKVRSLRRNAQYQPPSVSYSAMHQQQQCGDNKSLSQGFSHEVIYSD